jgi:N-sulfoglucosamine sulfohydrolase
MPTVRLRFCLPICYLLYCLPIFAQQRPNIVWIVCEDISPTLAFYGDSTVATPNLSSLAAESLVFRNAFAPVGVCAPTRSAIITGMYPTTIGTMHMRTGKDVMAWGKRTYNTHPGHVDLAGDSIIEYAAVPPVGVRCFTEYLREAGYYCSNNQKTDYQFAAPVTAWDINSNQAHWRKRQPEQPFFAVFNINDTHESKLWEHASKPLTVSIDKVPVPPYLPDNEATRLTLARHYSNVALMDQAVGKIIRQLKEDGLYDETIIFFYSDHGGPLPHQKRESYDTGLRTPLMVRLPRAQQKGYSDRLVSLVDLAATVLSLAGIQPPESIEGRAFMGQYTAAPNSYVFGSGDRFDEYTDRIRTVRNHRFRYVRNYITDSPKYKDVAYRKNIPMMLPMLECYQQNKLTDVQRAWFEPKSREELYDCIADPYNVSDISTSKKYARVLDSLRTALDTHLADHPDLGFLNEGAMIESMWPGRRQPVTATPTATYKEGKIHLHNATPGATIGYRWADTAEQAFDLDAGWMIYKEPFEPEQGSQYLYVIAERLGYRTSEQVIIATSPK